MHISSKAGTEILKSEYQITDSINGIPTLETEYCHLMYDHTEPMVMLPSATDDHYVMVVKESESVSESSRLKLTGVHSFIYDFSLDRLYEEYTQYFSLENLLSLVFQNTGYTFEVKSGVDYSALDFENFGDDDKMSLINQICSRWQLEYHVQGKKVIFGQTRGKKTSKQFRYKMNIKDSSVNLDISEGATYIRGYFGKKDEENPENSTYVEKEYTHPLAADFGVKHAKPVEDERVTQQDTMNRRMKEEIEKTWKLSVEIDVVDLIGDADAEVGDIVWAIDERQNLEYRTRIVEIRRYYDIDDRVYKTRAVLGNKTFMEAVASAEVDAEDLEGNIKYTNQLIEQLRADFDNEFNANRDAIKDAYQQAVIDAQAEVQAAEQRMQTEINTQRTDMLGAIETARTEAINQAGLDAEAKKKEVQRNLDSFKSTHQQMYDAVTADILDIDEFLGPKDKTLQLILDEQRQSLEQKIDVYNRNYPNLVVGSTLENIDGFEPFADSEIELRTEESLNYIRTYPIETGPNAYHFPDTVYLEQGKTYTLAFDFRSDAVEDLDYVYMIGPYNNVALPAADFRGFEADGTWHRYYVTFDWIDTTRQARLMIGTNFNVGDTAKGWFDTRQVHLYKGETHNIPWTPSPSDNAQVVSQLLYEVRQLEDGMSKLATKTEVNLLTGDVTQLTNEFTTTSEQLSSKLQKYDDVLGVNGSHFTQIADLVQSEVWLNDVADINPNLIPFSDVRNISDMTEYWSRFGANPTGSHATALDSDGFYVFRDTVAESNLALESATFEEIKEGEQYTLSFLAKTHSNINDNYNYTYIINPSGSNHYLGMWTDKKHIRDNIYLYEWVFGAQWTGAARVLIGSTTTSGTDASIRFKEPKLERGTVRTPYLNALSNIEQLANKIALQVQTLDGETIKQSSVIVDPDRVLIGSTEINGDAVGALLSVSSSGIDAVAEAMRLSGDLYVDGDIEALAVSAVKGDFASIFSDTADVQFILAKHLATDSIQARHLLVTNAMVDKFVANTAFINEIKTLSIDAVHADLTSVTSVIMQANIIKSEWLNVDTALIDRIVTTNFFAENATIKAANVRDLEAVTIDAVQANLTTVMNSMGQVEGGLSIRRPDGVYYLQNGIPRGNIPVQIFDSYADAEVEFTGLNFVTQSSHWKTFKYFYTPHEGSRLRVVWALGLHDGPSNVEYMEVRVSGFSTYNPINMNAGVSVRRATLIKGETTYVTQDIPMPPPNYNLMSAYLDFRRAPDGQSINNVVRARILHIGQYD